MLKNLSNFISFISFCTANCFWEMWSNEICAWCNVCVSVDQYALVLNLQTAVDVDPQYPVLLNIIHLPIMDVW